MVWLDDEKDEGCLLQNDSFPSLLCLQYLVEMIPLADNNGHSNSLGRS